MKIDIEKHIRNNRSKLDAIEAFDVDQMWNQFEQQQKPVPVRKIRPWYFLAAAVAVVLIGVTMFLNNQANPDRDDVIYQALAEIDPELAEEQVLMIKMVSTQDSLIKNLGITEMQFPELFQEIKTLDSLQMDYIQDLSNYRDRKNLTRTLLRHYQRKARVLERMLYEFEKQEIQSEYESDKEI